MDSLNSSFQISLDSTLESLDIPGLVVQKQQPEEKQLTDEPDDLIEKIARIYLKHNSSLTCLVDWVKLFNTRLEECEKLPEGKVQLLKLFREHFDIADIFFFIKCNKCRKSTRVVSEEKKGLKCSNCNELLKTNETNFFVNIPIEKQIVQSIKSNWAEISKFDTSEDKNGKSYADAHDGEILRSVLNRYKDTDINILSFCLNVDGANKCKSNSLSVWPAQLIQNYLPPHIRFLPQNIILTGLYYYKSSDGDELHFQEYMLPLINELKTLKQDFILMNIDNEDYKFKPVITHCSVDLPAKSKIQETKQYGGYDACTYCEIHGELVPIDNSKTKAKKNAKKKPEKKSSTEDAAADVMSEPEKKSRNFVRYVDGDYKLRDEVETYQKMLEAATSNGKVPIDGIKDISCLIGLEHFNILWSIGVEYMHCCLEGVQKRLFNLFFNPIYSNKEHYITPSSRKRLDKKIMNIKPTASIVRKPRSLFQRSNFKASEYRSMLLYYLPVCLPGSLKDVYVEHVRLFSAAIYILLKKNFTSEEVDSAQKMLQLFVKQHQELFGKRSMVMVVHLLIHLPNSVRKLGPLWCFSAFPFERNNGCLLKLANGTSDVQHQISSKYCLAKALNKRNEGSDTEKNENILLGKGIDIIESASHVFDISSLEILNFANKSLCVHKRIRYKQNIYTSLLYTRPKRSIDYFVGLQDGTIGTAKYYFDYKEKMYVMIAEFEIIDTMPHIFKVLTTNRLIIAHIEEIEQKYLFMNVGLNNYIVCRPNPYENE